MTVRLGWSSTSAAMLVGLARPSVLWSMPRLHRHCDRDRRQLGRARQRRGPTGQVGRGAGVAEAYDAMTGPPPRSPRSRAAMSRSSGSAPPASPCGRRTTARDARDGYEARHGFAIGCADLAGAGAKLPSWRARSPTGCVIDSVGRRG